MARRILLITDLDNTLYNWVDYFAPCFRAMMHAVSREIGVDERILVEQSRDIYSARGTLEYAWLVQELPVVRKRPADEIERIVKVGSGAFRSVRRRRLEPYDQVKSTLQHLRDCGVVVVGASNAPHWSAHARLRQLRIDHLLAGLVAWRGFPPDPDDPFARVQKRRTWKFRERMPWTQELDVESLKPEPLMYENIVDHFGSDASHVWVIGDSISKDLAPAKRLGMATVWASYGREVLPRNLETILSITPWSEAEVDASNQTRVGDADVEPDAVAKTFADVMDILPGVQTPLF